MDEMSFLLLNHHCYSTERNVQRISKQSPGFFFHSPEASWHKRHSSFLCQLSDWNALICCCWTSVTLLCRTHPSSSQSNVPSHQPSSVVFGLWPSINGWVTVISDCWLMVIFTLPCCCSCSHGWCGLGLGGWSQGHLEVSRCFALVLPWPKVAIPLSYFWSELSAVWPQMPRSALVSWVSPWSWIGRPYANHCL